jgi:hypothetical protein
LLVAFDRRHIKAIADDGSMISVNGN